MTRTIQVKQSNEQTKQLTAERSGIATVTDAESGILFADESDSIIAYADCEGEDREEAERREYESSLRELVSKQVNII